MDDDRVDAVISHLEGVNTTLKSLRSQGGDLEPFLGSEQVKSHFLKANNPVKSWASLIEPYASPAACESFHEFIPVCAVVMLLKVRLLSICVHASVAHIERIAAINIAALSTGSVNA